MVHTLATSPRISARRLKNSQELACFKVLLVMNDTTRQSNSEATMKAYLSDADLRGLGPWVLLMVEGASIQVDGASL